METFSVLKFPVQSNLLVGSGNLKVKCVVSMWSLYHKSNEISIEIQGLDPNPKSIRHSQSVNPTAASDRRVELDEVFHRVAESGAGASRSFVVGGGLLLLCLSVVLVNDAATVLIVAL